MDLVSIFRELYERKYILLIATILAAATAYFLTSKEEKYYRSSAQVSTGFTISDEIKIGNSDFSIFEADTKFNNVIVTATSPTVTSLLSYKLILHDLTDKPFTDLTEEQKKSAIYRSVNRDSAKRIFANKLETMSVLTSYRADEKDLIEFLKLYDYDYKSIQRKLGVYRLQRTDYLQIEYVSSNPELSAFVVNNLYAQFIRYYKYVRSSRSNESLDTLRSLLDKKKQELTYKTAIYIDEAGVDATIESSSKLDIIANLEKMVADEKNKQTILKSTLEKIDNRLAAAGKPVGGGYDNNELLDLRKQRDDTYAEYLRTGSSNVALYSKYIDLKNKIQHTVLEAGGQPSSTNSSSDLSQLKSDAMIDIQTSSKNIAALEGRIQKLKGNVIQSASKNANTENLTKEVEQANKEYLDAKQKYNDAIDLNSSSVNNFRQVLFGQPALDPEPSKRKLVIGMAGIGTFLVLTLSIVLLSYFDSSVKTPRIFTREIALKLISTINFMDLRGHTIEEIITNAVSSKNNRNKTNHNAFRSSVRKLRYEIERSGKNIFLFASTKKAQGKTTIIQALSFSLSLSKKKILIIDTNFCNNDLTVQLHANPVLELSNISTEPSSIMDVITRNATRSENGYIYVIGSEGGDYSPDEIITQQNLLNYLPYLKNHFDYIFLEGPPLNDFADSKELSQYVEGVIGVFSADSSITQSDKESINFYKSLGDKYSGSVLNKVDLKNINMA